MQVNWVVGGTNDNGLPTTFTSSDGQIWNATDISNPGTIFGVAYDGNGTWISIGENNTLNKSTDGITWNDISGGPGTGRGIATDGQGTWVAVGSFLPFITRSTNGGQTWENLIPVLDTLGEWLDVAYGQNTWMAVGTGVAAVVNRSVDGGQTWNDVNEAFGGGGDFSVGRGVAFDNTNTWIAVGVSPSTTISRSVGGQVWEDISGGFANGGVTTGGFGIAYGEGIWIAVGESPSILRSSNGGVTWESVTGGFSIRGHAVTYGQGTWIAVGEGTDIMLTSTDGGQTWGPVSVDLISGRSIAFRRLLNPQVIWVAVGKGSTSIVYSTDGISWNDASASYGTLSGGGGGYGKKVAYGTDSSGIPLWVSVGNGSQNTIWSTDGKIWNDASFASGIPGGWRGDVAFGYSPSGAPLWISAGLGSSILWSSDGKTWNDASSGFGDGSGYIYGNGVAYGKDPSGVTLWVAAGSGSSPIIWSYDGKSWNDASSGVGDISGYIYGTGVAYGKDSSGTPLWVATGYGTSLVWSYDGKSWNDGNGEFIFCDSVAYGKDSSGTPLWVATGNGSSSIKWSYDGKIWNDASSIGTISWGLDVAYNDGNTPLWVLVGRETNTIVYSYDGKSWTDASGMNFNQGFGVASKRILNSPGLPPPWIPPPPCFVQGTRVLTPSGYMKIETIQSGDNVLTTDNRVVPIKLYSFTTTATAETAPYKIQAGALGSNIPSADLHVSPRHAVKDGKGRWQIPKYLGKKATQYGIGESVTYYHIECPNYYTDNLVVEGTVVESFKNKQGLPGVIYSWNKEIGGWDRTPQNNHTTVPNTLKTYMIYSA